MWWNPFASRRAEPPPPDGRLLYVWVRPMALRDGRPRPDRWRVPNGSILTHVRRARTPTYSWLDEGVIVLPLPTGASRAGVNWAPRWGRRFVVQSVDLLDTPAQLLHYVYDGQARFYGSGRIAVEAIDDAEAERLGAVAATPFRYGWTSAYGRGD